MCACVVIPFILDVKLVGVTAGVTQEKRHTVFFRLFSAVYVSIFTVQVIQGEILY